ncbi:MAG TPA: enoyl-CoA hydratase/isomerase family protein [Dehalococcoidia bacterium]|nr:enoyl-CoA hydratase/isomerase family protein [Dehalococcoidia bacterium]
MNSENILFKKEYHVAVITLNRPDNLNALLEPLVLELSKIIDEVDKDDDIRAVVVTGAGKAFSAGGDLNEFVGGDRETFHTKGSAEGSRQGSRMIASVIPLRFYKLMKPTIAMVNGPAVAGGLVLACACDLRVGSENARFINGFIKIGLTPGLGLTWIMPRLIGLPRALEFLYLGRPVYAEEAERIGLLNKLVPANELEKTTMELAHGLADGPPLAIRLTKMQTYKGIDMPLDIAMEFGAASETLTLLSEDHREGLAGFREKRKPMFRGR